MPLPATQDQGDDQVVSAVITALATSPDRATRAAQDPLNKKLSEPSDAIQALAGEQMTKIEEKLRNDHSKAELDLVK